MNHCCRVWDLRDKEVINIKNGVRIGCVDDLEINTKDATIISIVIYGRKRFFGLLGREEDVLIHWKHIEIMGEDTILVNYDGYMKKGKKNNLFARLWGN